MSYRLRILSALGLVAATVAVAVNLLAARSTVQEPTLKTYAGADQNSLLDVHPRMIDFGTVLPPCTLRREVVIENPGPGDVTVSAITKTCGCTSVDQVVPFVLHPKHEVKIPVEVSLDARKQGRIENSLTLVVESDPQKRITIPLVATAEFQDELRVFPDQIDFGDVGNWEARNRRFSITGVPAGEVPVVAIDESLEGLVCTVQQNEDSGDWACNLMASNKMPIGEFSEGCTVSCSLGELRVAVRGVMHSGGYIHPYVTVFRTPKNGEQQTRRVIARHPGKLNADGVRLASDSQNVKFVVKNVCPAEGHTLIDLSLNRESADAPRRGLVLITLHEKIQPIAHTWFFRE